MKTKKNIADKIIELFENIGILKRLPRMGWKIRGVPECETVAAHSFRVVFIALIIGELIKNKYEINFEKLLKCAVLHEIPETYITDLALKPAQYIGFDIKKNAEISAFKDIFKDFKFGAEYLNNWLEFENSLTIEGKIVRIADKMDMMIQAYEYEKNGTRGLEDFWRNSANFENYEIDIVADIYGALKKKKKELRKD